MQIDIQTKGFELTEALRRHIIRRLGFRLSISDQPVQRVNLHLMDENGPRGGKDKRCRIRIILARVADVVVEDTQVDLYLAIDRAIDRAGRSLNRRLERQRDWRQTSKSASACPLPQTDAVTVQTSLAI